MTFSICYKGFFSGLCPLRGAIWLFFLLLSLPGYGQKQETVRDTAVKSIPALITPGEFATKLPETVAKVINISKGIIPAKELDSLKTELDTFLLRTEKFEKSIMVEDSTKVNARLLRNHIYLWQQLKEKNEEWQERLILILKNLNNSKNELNDINDLWSRSLEKYAQEIPAENEQVLRNDLKRLTLFTDTIDMKSKRIMRYLQLLANNRITVDTQISKLEAYLKAAENISLTTKGPSLFKIFFKHPRGSFFVGNIRNNIRQNLLPINNYLANNKFKLLWVVFIFLSLYVGLLYFRKNISLPEKTLSVDSNLKKALSLLQYPFHTAMFLSLVLARLILMRAPHDFYTIIWIFTIIPLTILVPQILSIKIKLHYYVVALVFFLMNLSDLVFYGSVINNIILLVLGTIMMLSIAHYIKIKLSYRLLHWQWVTIFLRRFNQISVIILGITVILTFFGYYTFEEFIIKQFVWVYFALYLFYAGNVIISGLFELLIFSQWIQKVHSIKKYGESITKSVSSILDLATLVLWILVVISLFGFKDPVFHFLEKFWDSGFKVGSINITVGNIIIFVLTVWISLWLARIIQSLLEEDILVKFKMERGMPKSISILAKYIIAILGFFIAAGAANMNLDKLAFIFGALGVGIGFGLQDIINNFISGLILLFERPIHIGDNVSVGNLEGVVKHIGIRSSIIQSYDRSEVVVPNSKLVSNEVINWTLSNKLRRLELEVGVAYGTDMKKVENILLECAAAHKDVLKDPPPLVWFKEFADSSINFRLLFYFPQFEGALTARSEVAKAVFKRFDEENITIPFPQRDIYLKPLPGETNNPSVDKKTTQNKKNK